MELSIPEFIVPKKELLRLVSRCHGVADKKAAMPVLANVLLTVEGNALRVAATDLYLAVSGQMNVDVQKPGSVALPAKDDGAARRLDVVLGVRPEFVRFDPASALRGRVVVDAFQGACRYAYVEGEIGRVAVRRPAEERAEIGAEVGLAFDPAGVRRFDPETGRRRA